MDNSKKPHRENPRKNANFLSVILITWIWPLLYKGLKKGLTQDDLTKTMESDKAERLVDELEREWTKEKRTCHSNRKNPSLRRALIKAYCKPFIINGLLNYLYVAARTVVPIILAQLLKQYQSLVLQENPRNITNTVTNHSVHDNNGTTPATTDSFPEDITPYFDYIWNDRVGLTILLISVSFFSIFVFHSFELRQKMLGTRMRAASCSAIYRKTLRLSKNTCDETSVGYAVNLLSNDVSRLNTAFELIHYIWITPVQSIIICYILYDIIGPAAFIGVCGLLIKVVPLQSFLTKITAKLRLKVAIKTDKRVGMMNELINGILVIKMYTWEKPFQAIVAKIRRLEIKQIRYVAFITGICGSSHVIVERSTLFITLAAMLYFNIPISASVVFSIAIHYNTLQLIVARGFSVGLSMLAEGLVSIKRIEQFLNLHEHDVLSHGLVTIKDINISQGQPILKITKASATWGETKQNTLENVTFRLMSGQLCGIIGPVGSGKSSLFQAILGELPLQSGCIGVTGSISYGSQEPWLFSGTVRNNILFGESFDQTRYNEVIECCGLTIDLKQLPYEDQTVVGERGISLSGGQKARISLARAVYKQADIYLFDDPLSAVDTNVGWHLYKKVIGPAGFLAKKGAARVLITHQTQFLKDASWIVVIENGRIYQQGPYQDHANSPLNFKKFLNHEKSENSNKTEVNRTDSSKDDDENEEDHFQELTQEQPLLTKSGSVSNIHKTNRSKQSSNEIYKPIGVKQSQESTSLTIWIRYFQAVGSICYLLYAAFILVFAQIVASICDYFVNIWTHQEFLRANNLPTTFTTDECFYIYTALISFSILFLLFRCHSFFIVCMRASKTLHDNMFAAILHAPMQFFANTTPGEVLNRFSRDMGNIDELFPRSFWIAMQCALKVLGHIGVVLVVNPTLLFIFGGTMILYVLLTYMYLPAAQDLKRLEGTVRGPLLGHLSATLNGLTTIRVNKVQQKLENEFDELQNVHTNVWQLLHASSSAFGLWLDIISCIFVGFVAFSFVALRNSTFAGDVGLALSQAFSLTGMLQFGVRHATDAMQLMTCVERIREYCDVKPEQSPENKPSQKWPKKGHIKFNDMSYRYDQILPYVLKKIKLEIKPGWKVGIVGRTGAGKSSLIGALFRLGHIDGQIIIDDIDTAQISLENLRQNITIIPQDPVLFSATIRYNLDPFGLYTDEQLWNVLDEVEMTRKIENLDSLVTEGGSNFSVGERQLICLARAILRSNKIFVLDEATANVDSQTDELIQKTVRKKFADCTVLAIAHRLNTVMDSDRILVLDAGMVREFDTPQNLVQNKNSYLSNMIAAGKENESA